MFGLATGEPAFCVAWIELWFNCGRRKSLTGQKKSFCSAGLVDAGSCEVGHELAGQWLRG